MTSIGDTNDNSSNYVLLDDFDIESVLNLIVMLLWLKTF